MTFEYAGAVGAAFRLAPSGFVAFTQSGGYVYDITVALPDRSKPLAEAYATAVYVDRVLAGTEWRRSAGPLPPLEQIERELHDSTAGFGGNRGLGQWRLGATEISLTLKRTAGRGERTDVPGRRLSEDLYVVDVDISDGSRVDAYDARLLAIRRARQGGDARRALGLDAVLDDPTPIPPPAGAGR